MNKNICNIVENLNFILNPKNIYIEFKNSNIKCKSSLKDYDIRVVYNNNLRIFEPYNFYLDLKNFSLLYCKKENLKVFCIFVNQYTLRDFNEFIISNQNEYIENLKDTIGKYIKLEKYIIKKCKYIGNLYCYNSKLNRNLISLNNFLKKNKKNYIFIVNNEYVIFEKYKNANLYLYDLHFNSSLSFSEINFFYDFIQKGKKL
ncbi:MAG: hypothetical protein ABGX26_06765 [Nautiliaceae bacterium]